MCSSLFIHNTFGRCVPAAHCANYVLKAIKQHRIHIVEHAVHTVTGMRALVSTVSIHCLRFRCKSIRKKDRINFALSIHEVVFYFVWTLEFFMSTWFVYFRSCAMCVWQKFDLEYKLSCSEEVIFVWISQKRKRGIKKLCAFQSNSLLYLKGSNWLWAKWNAWNMQSKLQGKRLFLKESKKFTLHSTEWTFNGWISVIRKDNRWNG